MGQTGCPAGKSDRRRYPRSETTQHLKLGIRAQHFDLVGEVRNLSRHGAYCRVDKPIAEMTQLMMVLDLNTDQIKCDGTVVRLEPVPNQRSYHIAIFFNNISRTDQEKIDILIEN